MELAALELLEKSPHTYNGRNLVNTLAPSFFRLIGELIGYSWSGVRRPLSFTMLKDLLRNRWADQSQILCGAYLGRGNDILFAASGSHDQDGRHDHIWSKTPPKIFFSRTSVLVFTKLGM